LKLSFPPNFFDDKKGKAKDAKDEVPKPADDSSKPPIEKEAPSDADMEALEKEMEKDDDKPAKVEEE